jgi:hypothetical protein
MIVDQYGNPAVSQKFNRSSDNRSLDRPWIPTRLDNIDKLIPSYDRNTLVAVSRMLVENWGPTRGIARQIPMYSVGRAWKPTLTTTDESVKSKAETAMREQFCQMADLQGRDFSTSLYHMAHLLIRDGEVFYLLTEWETGFPAIQIIPCHRIGQREWGEQKVKSGTYQGLTISEGVIRNRYGRPIAYRVLGVTPDLDEDISSRSLKHVYDSDYPEARRGYPALSHGLNDGRDALQAHEWERINMLARSSHTLIEHSETGIPDNHPSSYFDADGDTIATGSASDISTNTLFGGIYKTVRAGTGYKLESVEHNTPGETWESFGDRMIRKMCAGIPWPFSFVWEGRKTGGGTAERRDIMQARQTVEDMQCTLEKEAKAIMGYAFKKLVKTGAIPDSSDWWRWSFSKPPKLTVDDGRVSKANLELWRAGVLNDEDLLSDMGKDHDEHFRNRFTRAADKELMFNEIQETKGVELDIRYKGMFTPNDMGNIEPDEEPETNQPNQDNGNTDQY